MACIYPDKFLTWNFTQIFLLPPSEALRKFNLEKSYKLSSSFTIPFCLVQVGTHILQLLVKKTSCSILKLFLLPYHMSNLDHLWISSLFLLIETTGNKKYVIRSMRKNTLEIGNYALLTRISKQLPYLSPYPIRLNCPSLFFFSWVMNWRSKCSTSSYQKKDWTTAVPYIEVFTDTVFDATWMLQMYGLKPPKPRTTNPAAYCFSQSFCHILLPPF